MERCMTRANARKAVPGKEDLEIVRDSLDKNQFYVSEKSVRRVLEREKQSGRPIRVHRPKLR